MTVPAGPAVASSRVLFTLPEEAREVIEDAYARTVAPEGFERRGLLDKAAALIERSARVFMEETTRLMPPGIAKASPHDQTAAARAERLAQQEQQRAEARMVQSMNRPASPHSPQQRWRLDGCWPLSPESDPSANAEHWETVPIWDPNQIENPARARNDADQ
jgi:hypothetical protein